MDDLAAVFVLLQFILLEVARTHILLILRGFLGLLELALRFWRQ